MLRKDIIKGTGWGWGGRRKAKPRYSGKPGRGCHSRFVQKSIKPTKGKGAKWGKQDPAHNVRRERSITEEASVLPSKLFKGAKPRRKVLFGHSSGPGGGFVREKPRTPDRSG